MAYYVNDVKVINDSAEVPDGKQYLHSPHQYKSIKLGDQIWMAENLRETHFRDGTPIPYHEDNNDWKNATAGAYAVYDNDLLYGEFYGYLYNFEAAANGTDDCTDTDHGGLAPLGWHVPTDAEWTTLEDYLDDSDDASMLADRMDLWNTANTTLIDSSEFGTSSFNALPAGHRYYSNGSYGSMGLNGYFWSSSENTSSHAWNRVLNYGSTSVLRYSDYKPNGYSVRCIKDV